MVVGMSGGVDSSVAASLLAASGHELIGITLRTAPWRAPDDEATRFGACCSPEGARGARAVARQLGIPYYVLNHEREFADTVVADFTREYARGRTPSPSVVCNREIKFGTLLRRALAWEAEQVATGHYARLDRDPGTGRLRLLRGQDPQKDQSYFLWPLRQAQLERAVFPVGGMSKAEVRAHARRLGLATAEVPESQELCFVEGDYRAFLRERVPTAFQPGPILDEAGREIGAHQGLGAYTVGQRRGLGPLGAGGPPRYVVRLDPARNALIVGDQRALQVRSLIATQVNWVSGEPLDRPRPVEARVRHGAPLAAAEVVPRGPAAEVELRFRVPQRAVAPGQSVVFYAGEEVLGGGVVETSGEEASP
jgi:tRNA-specific 2-thiouridylase